MFGHQSQTRLRVKQIGSILSQAKIKLIEKELAMTKGDFWDSLKKKLVEVSNAAADFTEEQAMVGKLKFDILNLKRKIDRDLHDIGSKTLDISRSEKPYSPLDDKEVRSLLASIRDLEHQIEKKKDEIGKVADAIHKRRGAETKAHAAPAAAAKPAPKKPAAAAAKKPAAARPAAKPAVKKPAVKKAAKPVGGAS